MLWSNVLHSARYFFLESESQRLQSLLMQQTRSIVCISPVRVWLKKSNYVIWNFITIANELKVNVDHYVFISTRIRFQTLLLLLLLRLQEMKARYNTTPRTITRAFDSVFFVHIAETTTTTFVVGRRRLKSVEHGKLHRGNDA